MVVDSQETVYVLTGDIYQKTAAGGNWSIVTSLPSCYNGCDVWLDPTDNLHWARASYFDASDQYISVDNNPIIPRQNGAGAPTLAGGPNQTMTLVWQMVPLAGDDTYRLYLSTNRPITKYYYANGRPIATRVNGEVYYLHSDHPSSSSGQAWAVPPCSPT